jgi:hypothetical protein
MSKELRKHMVNCLWCQVRYKLPRFALYVNYGTWVYVSQPYYDEEQLEAWARGYRKKQLEYVDTGQGCKIVDINVVEVCTL